MRILSRLVWLLTLAFALGACGGAANLPGAGDFPATAPIKREVNDEDVGVEVELHKTEYRLKKDGGFARRTTQRYRITSEQGVRGWGYVSARYAPWYEKRPVITATVTTADGKVTKLDPSTISDAAAYPDAPDIYSDNRLLRAPLPNVGVGAVVEEIIEEETTSAFPGRAYTHYALVQTVVPRKRVELTIEIPDGVEVTHELRDAELEMSESTGQGSRTMSFVGGPYPAVVPPEAGMPYDVARFPYLAFTTGKSWSDIVQFYEKAVQAKLGALDLSKVAKEVTASIDGTQAKAAALLAWLHERVRYTGIEFGESAIVPYAPSETLERGYGDCKDQATLLVALLRGAGIEANVALLRAGYGEDVRPKLPALNVFNHAIVRMKGDAGDLWIDPTSETARVGELPSPDAHRLALIVSPDTEDLVRTPTPTSADNTYREDRTVTLAELGRGRLEEVTHASGAIERSIREGMRGNGEDLSAWAKRYVAETYNSQGEPTWETSDLADVDDEFRVKVAVDEVGMTHSTLFSAEVLVEPNAVLQYASGALTSTEERKTPLFVPMPYKAELHYRIIPPEGLIPQSLPRLAPVKLGPVTLVREVKAKGTEVELVYRIDMKPTRWSAEQVNAFRQGLAALVKEETRIEFIHTAYRLSQQHRPKEEVKAYRALVAKHPKSPIHRMRLAIALYDLRLGAAGKREAQEALKLGSDQALLHYHYADLMMRNAMGHMRGKGWDRASAAAALRKAMELDPDELLYPLTLAEAYEYNEQGYRYGNGAPLDKAVEVYDAIDPEKLAAYRDGEYVNNVFFALLHAGRYEEARTRLSRLSADKTPWYVAMGVTAILDGAPAGLAEAERLGIAQESRASSFAEVAGLLVKVRRYPEALAFTEAMARQLGNVDAKVEKRIALQKKLKKIDPRKLPRSKPFDAAVRAFAILMSQPPDPEKTVAALVSKRSFDDDGESAVAIALETIGSRSVSAELSPEVLADFAAVGYELKKSEGDDASGYRLKLESGQGTVQFTVFLVKEGSDYRFRAFGGGGPLGCEALHLVQRNKADAATQWLDWAREDTPSSAGEDPLRLSPFIRLWKTKASRKSDPSKDTVRAAAAALCSAGTMHDEAARALESARGKASKDEKIIYDHALALAYDGHDEPKRLKAVERLIAAEPDSIRARGMMIDALIDNDKGKEARDRLKAALKKDPNDDLATYLMPLVEKHLGNYAEAKRWGQKALKEGKASSQLLNNLAWMALFAKGGVRPEDLDFARKSVGQDASSVNLHTLASLYAEAGQVYNAKVTLDKLLALRRDGLPLSIDQFVIGRMAEELSMAELARDAYGAVERPKRKDAKDTTYDVAQRRLKQLKGK